LLYGKTGDTVKVTYEVGGQPLEVELKLAPEPEEAVIVDLLPGNIGYIRLPTFVHDEAVEAFMQGLAAICEQANYDLRGLIFDLRNNSGGKFENALSVSSLFIKEGIVTKSKTRSGRQVSITDHTVVDFPAFTQSAMPPEMLAVFKSLQTVPMVILVNGSTASASEVTTGALRDNGRAYVIGTKTFGKGVGYSMGRLPNGGGLTVTSLSYLTPKGFDLGGKGIDPDKVVENPRGQDVDAQKQAAVDYLNAQTALRMKQLQNARTQAVQPHDKSGALVMFTTLNGTSVSVGLGVVAFLIILALFLAARRARRNAIKGGAKPGDDCGCPGN
jgi:C-terminal peptidase prc